MERLMRRLNGSLSRSVRRSIQDVFQQSPLDLRFALQKTLDPRVTFTRASNGTFVGSDGVIKTAATNEPRFDHNPTTGESLGLLVEEARTNLLSQSENLTVGAGTTVSLNTATSPLGTTTAATVTEDSSTGLHSVLTVSISFTAVSTTCSFFGKANGRNWVGLRVSGITRAWFNLSTGQVGTVDAATTATSVQAFSNGFYRCSATFTPTAGTANIFLRIGSADAVDSYAGNGTSGIITFGIQAEAGAFPTSYIPTTTATATRAADVASITGSNFSSFYNQTEGTVFSSFRRISYTGTSTVVSINDNTTNNRLYNFRQDTVAALTVISATAGSVDASPSLTLSSGASVDQVAVAQQLNNFGASANGGTVATDSTVLMPTVTQANIGNVTSSSFFNGTIKRFTYWPTRLANTTLQQITQS
jgi:hypothetical protein